MDDFWTPELREWLQPGRKVRIFYGDGNINNWLLYIRAVVDDDWIVSRYWNKSRQNWMYRVDSVYWFLLHQQGGHLKFGGKEQQ